MHASKQSNDILWRSLLLESYDWQIFASSSIFFPSTIVLFWFISLATTMIAWMRWRNEGFAGLGTENYQKNVAIFVHFEVKNFKWCSTFRFKRCKNFSFKWCRTFRLKRCRARKKCVFASKFLRIFPTNSSISLPPSPMTFVVITTNKHI